MSHPFDVLKNQHESLHLESFHADEGRPELRDENQAYAPEAAANFFEELEDALELEPDYSKVYDRYNQVFQKCVNQKIADTELNFGGTFAKVDYLLKELKAPKSLVRGINDTRIFLRKRHEMLLDEKQKRCYKDLKSICKFIAFIYEADIPTTLSQHFPLESEEQHKSAVIVDCVRFIIEHWNDQMVYGTLEDGTSVEVNYRKNKIYDFDWSYLKTMFYKRAQLNLIRPREDEGVYYPELIIFEPDYLVDVSTVANCFTEYGESAFIGLINKLKTTPNTEAIVLGNFASQLLDEEIHQLPNTHTYIDSVKDFFKDNSIALTTTEISNDFHKNAQRQKQNIERAIHETLPQYVKGFSSKDGIVEPSFFSEMLGLQGRMDYLQLDFKVLMEQKSGKGAYIPRDDFSTPHVKETNYVQLLLYMLFIRYNHSDIYEQIKDDFHAFLLYSKYQNSLCLMSWAPELTFKALKVRNGIAWAEQLYATEEGIKILDSLTPEQLNSKNCSGPLWENFTKPELDNFFAEIHNASSLERAYYFRFLTFIFKEHILSKLGNKTKENSGFASKWYDALEEKLASGNIYNDLTLIDPDYSDDGNIAYISLSFKEKANNDMSNFRIGDPVILFPYLEGTEPDVRKAIVFRASISKCTADVITLKLRNVQTDVRAFRLGKGKKWAIEHDYIDSSDNSLLRGMHAFLSAPQSRRDLLLLQRGPEVDENISLVNDYGDFNKLSLSVKQAQDFFLIIGPPGTGKTSFGLVNTLMEELTNAKSQVLLLSYTNRAVDEICSKLAEKGLDYIRIGNELACDEEYRPHLLANQVKLCSNLVELKEKIVNTRIFVSTTASLNANIGLFKLKQFDLAIIDEASQILEPHLMGLLCHHIDGLPSIRKFVMIGDQKQLPAVVQQTNRESRVSQKELNEIFLTDCRLSLFERLLKKYESNAKVTYMLHKQGRMHEEIAMFPNYAFYDNKLDIVGDPYCPHQNKILSQSREGSDGLEQLLTSRRISFIAVDTPENSPSEKVNQEEADVIATLVAKIYEITGDDFDVNETIGVIVPYRNQIATVRNTIEKYNIPELTNIAIDTVERYQGSQRKYIIYGFTIQQYYQLNFLTSNTYTDGNGNTIDRKLNVAMTRAQEHLIMVGNPKLLANNRVFHKLVEFIRVHQGYFELKKEDFLHGNFIVPKVKTNDFEISRTSFNLSPAFTSTFRNLIIEPLENASGNDWPNLVLGHDMGYNMNLLGYGPISIEQNLENLSPYQQVLLYCYYFMRQSYTGSHRLFTVFREGFINEIKQTEGRLQFMDFGGGPASSGIAFGEIFLSSFPEMVYTNIDNSLEMSRMGKIFYKEIFHDKLKQQTVSKIEELPVDYWHRCSTSPTTFIFNFSQFFSNINAHQAEKLAMTLNAKMKDYPNNKYFFVFQHTAIENELMSYKAFLRIISSVTTIVKNEDTFIPYEQNGETIKVSFCYRILTGEKEYTT